MRTPERPVWSEGLLMAPQHLQQQDAYHEALLEARLEAVSPLSYGVVDVELDRRALAAGQITLERFSGVLPGGLVAGFAAAEPGAPSSRPIDTHFAPTQAALEIFLGVARERDGSSSHEGTRARFKPRQREAFDRVGSAEAVQVDIAHPNAVLLFGDERRDDYDAIKIAEVVRDGTGALLVQDRYIPPCLRIAASPFLVGAVRRVVGMLETRRRTLSDARRERDAGTVEFQANDVTLFLLLSSVNAALPVMRHFAESPDLSPRALYLQLVALAGQLSTFAPQADMTLPNFVYHDLRATFEPLIARVEELLSQTVREQHVAIALEQREGGMFIAQLADPRLATCDRFFVAFYTDESAPRVHERLPMIAKVASWGDIHPLLSSATRGAELEATQRPPPEIPAKAGCVYFAVRVESPYWRNIATESRIAVFVPPTQLPAHKVELIGVPRRGQPAAR